HATARVDQSRQLGRRQGWRSVHQDEVEPDAEARHPAREPQRLSSGRPCNHETRGAENTVAMRELDRLVYFLREAEIVSGENQAVQRRPHSAYGDTTPSD